MQKRGFTRGSMDRKSEHQNDAEHAEVQAATKPRREYVPPAIVEEERFETLTLACLNARGVCGVRVPKS
jgi:hypothetical protein